MRGRKIFNGADVLQPDNTIWRAGANDATALHTDADLDINGLAVPNSPWQNPLKCGTDNFACKND
jgi:hypothetical protein